MTLQYFRTASLLVSNATEALDLSDLNFRFEIFAADQDTPTNAKIRIYNLSTHDANNIKNEYTVLSLQVGYREGQKGVIFSGTIVQVRRGRENATDSYIDIVAVDGDLPHNFATVKKTLDGNVTSIDQLNAIAEAMQRFGAESLSGAPPQEFSGGILPRGKVLYGMAAYAMRNLANTTQTSWTIRNGVLTIIPLQSPLANQAVVLTAKTGMIGLPEQTDNGIEVTCLINPLIVPGCVIQIDNASINEALLQIQYTSVNLLADESRDGMYKVLVVESSGDTRGNEWYQHLTCIDMDPTAKPGKQISVYGG